MLLFRLITRHLGPLYGISAVLFLLLVGGTQFAVFGRGYAPLLFLFIVALDAWDELAANPASRLRQLILFLALVAAVYVHYYGVLLSMAFGAAALAQSLFERRLKVARFVLLALAGAACTPLLPLMRKASQFRTIYWEPVTLTTAMAFYGVLLEAAIPPLILMLILVAVANAWSQREGRVTAERPPLPRLPFSTLLALGCLAGLPIVLFIMAKLYTGAFLYRFVNASAVAICLLVLALSVPMTVPPRVRIAALLVIPGLFLALAIARQARGIALAAERDKTVQKLVRLQQSTGVPVVFGDDGLFIEMTFAYPREKLQNCYFLYNALPDHLTNVDVAVQGLQQVMALQAEPFDTLAASHSSFVFFGNWNTAVLRRAIRDHATLVYHPGTETDLDYWAVQLR